MIYGIIGFCRILNEKQDTLITEKLSNIRVVRTGYHNQNRKIEGIVNEEKRSFILRGKDKALARNINDSNLNYIIIEYHSSTHRIESITIPQN